LEKGLSRFEGLKLFNEDKSSYIKTVEGAGAYYEAIKYLKNLRPMKPFEWSDELAKAAQDHVTDCSINGIISS